jgi:antirestriction protein
MSEHDNQRPEREPAPPGLHPRVWIGSLANYNAGRLHGDWVDAAVEEDELVDAVQRILATSKEQDAEEWGIFDYDEFGTFRVNEYDDLGMVSAVARGIAEHGAAFAAWAELHDGEASMLDQFEDAYLGEYDSIEDWARTVLDETGLEETLSKGLPASLVAYVRIDYEAWARDAVLGGDVHAEDKPGGGIWLFSAT